MDNVIFTAYELPTFDSVAGTEIMAKTADGQLGYVPASQLITTMDGAGLATDAALTAVSGAFVTTTGTTNSTLTTVSGSGALTAGTLITVSSSAASTAGTLVGVSGSVVTLVSTAINVIYNFADDTAAQSGGVIIGGLYHDSGSVKVRLV